MLPAPSAPVQPFVVALVPPRAELVPSMPAAAVTLLLLIVTFAGLPAPAPAAHAVDARAGAETGVQTLDRERVERDRHGSRHRDALGVPEIWVRFRSGVPDAPALPGRVQPPVSSKPPSTLTLALIATPEAGANVPDATATCGRPCAPAVVAAAPIVSFGAVTDPGFASFPNGETNTALRTSKVVGELVVVCAAQSLWEVCTV